VIFKGKYKKTIVRLERKNLTLTLSTAWRERNSKIEAEIKANEIFVNATNLNGVQFA
jgi:hypothetical protein